MLCSELGIFIALAFVKMPWMMTGDCGWATVVFFFFFFLRNKLTVSLGTRKKKKKKLHRVTGMRPTNSVKNIE